MKSLVSILLMLACYGLMANEAAPLAEDDWYFRRNALLSLPK